MFTSILSARRQSSTPVLQDVGTYMSSVLWCLRGFHADRGTFVVTIDCRQMTEMLVTIRVNMKLLYDGELVTLYKLVVK